MKPIIVDRQNKNRLILVELQNWLSVEKINHTKSKVHLDKEFLLSKNKCGTLWKVVVKAIFMILLKNKITSFFI